MRETSAHFLLLHWWVANKGDISVFSVALCGVLSRLYRRWCRGKPFAKGHYCIIKCGRSLCSYDWQSPSLIGYCFQSPFSVFLGNSMQMPSLERELPHLDQEEDVYHTVDDDEAFSVDLASRPPVPVPRPEASASASHQLPDNEPYISKGKWGRDWCPAGSSELPSRNSLDPLAPEPLLRDCCLLNGLQPAPGDKVRVWGSF